MNIRKPIDYSAMYTGLDQALERNLPQMELYLEIGKLVSARKEKGAAAPPPSTAPGGTSPTGNWRWSLTVRIMSGSCCQTTANRRSSPVNGFFFFSLNCCAGSRRSVPLPRCC